ncbi:hypothetical protein DRH29_04595 [candidate division Kazan bacterium]|uniref:Cell wall hydrolase SleB domain-containing protein n=1 Tax=candidate division Kazan bacterium TaxID=2202143 RepID=A0A420ZBJ4_UNCK3|nr:MAG: hypothetical protein DRH29_04595 [candidate division Kazan bacterium]
MVKKLIVIAHTILILTMLEIKGFILPKKGLEIEKQHPLIIFTMCIWGEARGCSFWEQVDVANVIRNRVKKMKKSYPDVILQRKQFSCFNKSDPNREKLLTPLKYDSWKIWISCFCAAELIYNNIIPDSTYGATHYYSGERVPYWAKEMVVTKETKHFKFLKERDKEYMYRFKKRVKNGKNN